MHSVKRCLPSTLHVSAAAAAKEAEEEVVVENGSRMQQLVRQASASHVLKEYGRLMSAGREANRAGAFREARRHFAEAYLVSRRPAAKLSSANMQLKLGDAAGALDVYLEMLRKGDYPPDHEVLHRKIREASGLARAVYVN